MNFIISLKNKIFLIIFFLSISELKASSNLEFVEHNYDDSIAYKSGIFQYYRDGNKTLATFLQPPKEPSDQRILYYDNDVKEFIQEKVLQKVNPGEDGRIRIPNTTQWPYCIHGKLNMTFNGRTYGGSGSLVGPHHVLTCGHNVYNYDTRIWAQKISLYPALNDNIAPFGEIEVTKVYTFKKWVDNGDKQFDMALLILNHSIGKYTGWGRLLSIDDVSLSQEEHFHITGYPGEKGLAKQMWSMYHGMKTIKDEQFHYEIDTSGGQSGSAIWIERHGIPSIVGVHTLGSNPPSLHLMSELPKNGMHVKGNIYIEKDNDRIKYTFIALNEKVVQGILDIKLNKELTPENSDRIRSAILEEESKRGHISPEVNSGVRLSHEKFQIILNWISETLHIQQVILPPIPGISEPQLSPKILNLFLEAEYRDRDLNAIDEKGNTLLYNVCQQGDLFRAKFLIAKGADINYQAQKLLPGYGKVGRSPLTVSSENGHVSVVKYLVENGADVNLADGKMESPLYIACWNGHLPVVDVLIEKGADIHQINIGGETPLVAASDKGYLPIVETLIKNKVNINQEIKSGRYPFYVACQNGHLPIVDALFTYGVDVNQLGKDKKTPLLAACEQGHLSVVKYLVDHKANIKHIDSYGKSALYVACHRGYFPVVQYLVEHEADINQTTIHGNSSLLAACGGEGSISTVSMVQYLVEHGADLKLINKADKTALDAARNFASTHGGKGKDIVIYLEYILKELPKDFDAQAYISLYPDLQNAVKNVKDKKKWAEAHYINHGRSEGRGYTRDKAKL